MLAEAYRPAAGPSASSTGSAPTATVTVLGAGYVGLVTGACLATLGHRVTVAEVDARRLGSLRSGLLPIREDGLDDIVDREVAAGRLRFEDAREVGVSGSDIVMIAVGTPSDPDGRIDLSYVEAAVHQVAHSAPDALIVIKSTVPPGTCERMERTAALEGAPGARVVSNPEFLREGRAVHDFMHPDRIVIGARDTEAAATVERLYAALDAPVLHCRPADAELAKYASNALLASRISFINEMSDISEQVGADIRRVAEIVGQDSRIGPAFLAAGFGWGGSCFPKDVHGLAHVAEDLGLASPMLRATIEANQRQRDRVLEKVVELTRHQAQPRVAILGLAFKPHTDDVRESPALWLATALHEHGINVRATDPWALANAERQGPPVTYVIDPLYAVTDADVAVLATEWPEFVAMDWREVARRMRGNVVIDARNALDRSAVAAAGLEYRSLGRDGTGEDAPVEVTSSAPERP